MHKTGMSWVDVWNGQMKDPVTWGSLVDSSSTLGRRHWRRDSRTSHVRLVEWRGHWWCLTEDSDDVITKRWAYHGQIQRRRVVQTAVDCGSISKLDPFRHVQPMKFMMQGICQTSLEFARVSRGPRTDPGDTTINITKVRISINDSNKLSTISNFETNHGQFSGFRIVIQFFK